MFLTYKKGMTNFLLVSVFIGIILIALSSHLFIQNFQYKDTISIENNYYKTQDIKHSMILASKKGAEEGKLIFDIKHTIWKTCVCTECIAEPTNCIIPSHYTCPSCGTEPSLEEEIKNRTIDHLVSLNNYYQEDERYSIKLWCTDTTQGELSTVSWDIKTNKRASVHGNNIENCHDYLSIYTNPIGDITIKFQKSTFMPSSFQVIGLSMYDPYTDISTVAFIPNTEEFDIS